VNDRHTLPTTIDVEVRDGDGYVLVDEGPTHYQLARPG
jgi:hypothetical protein